MASFNGLAEHLASRSFISRAACWVKVTTDFMRPAALVNMWAMRVSAPVLPVPAPAKTSTGRPVSRRLRAARD